MSLSETTLIKKFSFNSNSVLIGLPEEDLREIEENLIYRKYKKGKNVFLEGSYPSGIFYVKDGKIKKYKTYSEDKEQIIYICNKGELFGYSALLSEEPYPDSSAALVDSEVGFLSKEIFLNLLGRSAVLSVRLLKNLSHEFGVMVNNIINFAHKSVRERVALALLILHEKFRDPEKRSDAVDIILTRDDLASIVGTAVETLVRLLRDFKDEGLIEIQGRTIRVLQENKLMKMTNLY